MIILQMLEDKQISNQSPKVAWITYQVIAWLTVLGGIIGTLVLFFRDYTLTEIVTFHTEGDIVSFVNNMF